MGRAIVRDPKVFLFDEPLSNLDAKLRVAMRSEIKALHQRLKTTTVYVTHDQVEAMTMADRIAVMNEGRIEQLGEPLELYDRPANLFVAQFIGSPAMNVFDGVFTGMARSKRWAHAGRCAATGAAKGSASSTASAPSTSSSRRRASPPRSMVVEPMGAETEVLVRGAASTRFTVMTHGRASVGPGERVFLAPQAAARAPLRRRQRTVESSSNRHG